jgi:hypothetical protein
MAMIQRTNICGMNFRNRFFAAKMIFLATSFFYTRIIFRVFQVLKQLIILSLGADVADAGNKFVMQHGEVCGTSHSICNPV